MVESQRNIEIIASQARQNISTEGGTRQGSTLFKGTLESRDSYSKEHSADLSIDSHGDKKLPACILQKIHQHRIKRFGSINTGCVTSAEQTSRLKEDSIMSTVVEVAPLGNWNGGKRGKRKERTEIVYTTRGLTRARIEPRRPVNKRQTFLLDAANELPPLRTNIASPVTYQSGAADLVTMTRDGISTRGYDLLSSRGN